MSPEDLVFAPLGKWLNDYCTDPSDDALKGPHVPFILHGLIIQQPLMKMSFCGFFSPIAQSFKWREVAVYLCSLKENIWVESDICVFHFSHVEETKQGGDRRSGWLVLCLLWRPWEPQQLPLETTLLFILLSKRIHHVESLNFFSRERPDGAFLSLITHCCLM